MAIVSCFGFFRAASCLGACLALLVGSARAQATRDAPIGGAVLIERTPASITDAKASLGAVLTGSDTGANLLTYVAPDRATDGQQATVTYKTGQDARTTVLTLHEPAPTLTDPRFYSASFKALFGLFILAILVENGLALVFHWQPYLAFFNGRGANALVAFVFSYLFVSAFNLDITTTLMNVYSGKDFPSGVTGLVMTALIVAGGSAGVRRVMQSLGFRAPATVEQTQPTPPPNEAWIAVTLMRERAVGPVSVQIGPPNAVAVAGTISGTTHHTGLLRFFLRDTNRFPQSGGYRVTPGLYEVRTLGADEAGNALGPVVWGPANIGSRAIVDVQLKL